MWERKKTARRKASFLSEDLPASIQAIFAYTIDVLRAPGPPGEKLRPEDYADLLDPDLRASYRQAAAIWQEARFSGHPMEEAQRQTVLALESELWRRTWEQANILRRIKLKYILFFIGGATMKKRISCMLLSILLLCLCACGEKSVWRAAYERTGQALQSEVNELRVGSVGGEWCIIGLSRSGCLTSDAAHAYLEQADAYIRAIGTPRLHQAKSTENSRLILGITAAGGDVTNIGGVNLLARAHGYEISVRTGAQRSHLGTHCPGLRRL